MSPTSYSAGEECSTSYMAPSTRATSNLNTQGNEGTTPGGSAEHPINAAEQDPAAAMADQLRIMTEQVLLCQQNQLASQQAQQAMLEIIASLQRNQHSPVPAITTPTPAHSDNNPTWLANPSNPRLVATHTKGQQPAVQQNPPATAIPPATQLEPLTAAGSPLQDRTTSSQNKQNFHPSPANPPTSLPLHNTIFSPNASVLTLEQLKYHVRDLIHQENHGTAGKADFDLRLPYPTLMK